MTEPNPRCVALSGGVGGAKLALGLTRTLPAEDLTIIANTGDDFEHLGLTICPDIDTLTYTLAGISNPETGWGRDGETWQFMASLDTLGGETWFRLGDRDLATHVERSRRLAAGETLTDLTEDIRQRLGIGPCIVPMSDTPVRTIVETPDGPLPFQHYFVREQCAPVVTGFHFDGAADARPAPGIAGALTDDGLGAIVICPSNPFISIDPIFAVPGLRDMLAAAKAPVVAVSPIVGGKALKGPTAKMMTELGLDSSALAVARHYGDLLDGFVLDSSDARSEEAVRALGVDVLVTDTVMQTTADKERLAREVLSFAAALRARRTGA